MAESDTRSQLGDAISGAFTKEQYDFLVTKVLEIEKQAFAEFNCKNCGQRQKQMAKIPDAAAVIGGLEKLMNQSWGRPNEVQKSDQELVVNRTVILVESHEEEMRV